MVTMEALHRDNVYAREMSPDIELIFSTNVALGWILPRKDLKSNTQQKKKKKQLQLGLITKKKSL